ncbi:MAG: hypothetical protein J0L82_11395 [Deltaproteobacteria bacterium]|jgi:hypothetical protein|nr:hypothetical protein [Deltaproteobacteria bacterium]
MFQPRFVFHKGYQIALSLFFVVGGNVPFAHAYSRWDAHVTALARTYVPGLSINPNLGYSQKLWGEEKTPFYGYLRPYGIAVVSPSVYEGKLGLEVFPVSFLGVDLRRAWGRRFVDTRGQDCDQVECQGELGYTDLSFQMFLGYERRFASVRWTQTYFDAIESRTRRIYELGSAVLIQPGGERGDYLSVALGEELSGDLSDLAFGVLVQSNRFHGTDHLAEAAYLFGRLKMSFQESDQSSVTVGIGAFRSTLNVAELSLVASVVFSPRPALGFGR